ncbi:GmrSD restriction endonuclease domain-containing protein [Microbacterium lacticum]
MRRAINPQSEEEEAPFKALDAIRKRISEEVAKWQDPLDWLRDLRDRLLGLRVIWIEHSNEDDAYVIFETLNNRGKDLEVVDLLKNLLLNRLRGTGNSAADAARTTWDRMRNELEASESRKRIDPRRWIAPRCRRRSNGCTRRSETWPASSWRRWIASRDP